MRTHLLLPLLAVFAAAPATPLAAQEFSLGADLMSRYVWRGTDFGESASVQPTLAFSAGGFEIGTWASYGIAPEAADVNEHDLWISHGFETSSGTFTLGVTDYYFPNAGVPFFDFSDGGGAHWIEPFVAYEGPASFPISLFAGVFAYNDPDNSVYLEASYPFALDGVSLAFTAGASGGRSGLYGTDGFALINLGLSAVKEIQVTESFVLPVSVGYIVNPDMEKSYLVFGLSF
ncbi:MAG: hypothetical protein KatS3mg044_1027 [Rhodothermaceae bacterium]|nr:MAG: hypothetical protein KatS3mg044_1027 [Rhodothermaceae bacterium]